MTADHHDSRIGVIVLNWERPHLTIACLESISLMTDRGIMLWVVDNGSADDSVQVLQSWLVANPIGTLLQNSTNLGYAGGNNVGVRAAIRAGCEWVWILNNDTKVDQTALSEIRPFLATNNRLGLLGMSIVEYDATGTLQTIGGAHYQWWSSQNRAIGRGAPSGDAETLLRSGAYPDYPSGASMVLRSKMLEEIGLLAEIYWAYYEELDLTTRARQAGWTLAIAPRARVGHLFGGTLGSARSLRARSPRSAYYGARGAILLARKFRKRTIPTVVMARLIWAGLATFNLRPALGLATLRGIVAGLSSSSVWNDRR